MSIQVNHTSLLLQEAILSSRQENQKCFVAFLDACKAFNCAWHTGLLTKLYEYGISGDIWLLILFWYRHLSSKVLWNGSTSEFYKGSIKGLFSPPFYSIFVNDLLRQLNDSKICISLGSAFVGCPMYTDDLALALVANSPISLLYSRWAYCGSVPIMSQLI